MPPFAKDEEYLKQLYSMLVRTRVFDTKAILLQRTGNLGTYPSILGQEAVSLGVGASMLKEDVFCPYYRDVAAQLWRGVKMSEILLYWGGDERGNDFSNKDVQKDFPLCIPIGCQTLHAVGVAIAMKIRKEPRVVVTTLGDGGTSRGDFYEALNLAGVWKLPVVFVINNNQWAISLPRRLQSAAKTLAQKGIAGGIEGEQVDGNDLFAVRYAVGKAVARARRGEGPSLLEAISYRMHDHTTADDAKRYREDVEVDYHKNLDPILRVKQYLVAQQVWDEIQEQHLQEKVHQEVEDAVNEYRSLAEAPIDSLFDYIYAEVPEVLKMQKGSFYE